jgi:tRNA (pseudouridine54-N1)-methyltransferase
MPESAMIRFLQLLPQVPPEGKFLLKDLPGSGKRIDVLCRGLAACFEWAPMTWPKSSLEMIAIIGDTKILRFKEPASQTFGGELEWAIAIRDSLRGEPPGFITVSNGTLEDVIQKLNKPPVSALWVLDEKGSKLSEIADVRLAPQNSFMLGDHRGFDSQTMDVISKYKIPKISLGRKSYLSSHCLAAIISEFERTVR